MSAPSHLSPTKLNIEVMWKEPDALVAVHCFCLWYLLSGGYATIKKVNKLGRNSYEKNKLAHWGQLSGKMNSLIWWELGNTAQHKGVQSIKWKSETYWHCMIRAFHPFCSAYPFKVRTVHILSWNSDCHEFKHSCWVQVSMCSLCCHLLSKGNTAEVDDCSDFASNNQSKGELSVKCMLHGITDLILPMVRL